MSGTEFRLKGSVMLGDGALTFKEFAMREPLPLATVHRAVLEFLQNVDDAVLFGAGRQRLRGRAADDAGRGHCQHARPNWPNNSATI